MARARLDEDAEAELREAAAYYEQQQHGLGRDFLLDFRAVLGRVEQLFGSGSLVAGFEEHEVRRFVFKRFPYKLLAVQREDGITVLAVAHDRRRPGYWRERLEPRGYGSSSSVANREATSSSASPARGARWVAIAGERPQAVTPLPGEHRGLVIFGNAVPRAATRRTGRAVSP